MDFVLVLLAPDPPSLALLWSTGLTEREIPMQYNTSAEVYADNARRVKSAKCTYRRNRYEVMS